MRMLARVRLYAFRQKSICRGGINMMSSLSSAEEFKDGQRQRWSSVSEGWKNWWRTFENGAQNISSKLVELVHTKPGDKVLDIATGIGEPAVTAAKRVGNNGRNFAAAVWGAPDKVPFLALPTSIVRQETQSPSPAPGTPGPFGFADENLLRNTFIQARFKDVYIEHLNAIFEFNSAQDFTLYQQAIAAPVIAMLANETRSRQDEIWNKVTEAAAKKYSDENGHVKFINDCICIVGRK